MYKVVRRTSDIIDKSIRGFGEEGHVHALEHGLLFSGGPILHKLVIKMYALSTQIPFIVHFFSTDAFTTLNACFKWLCTIEQI